MTVENILGTNMPDMNSNVSAFSRILPLIVAAGGFTLSQVKAITGLEGSTIQNWVKRGWVPNPKGKKYNEKQLPRILLISALRDGMQIDQIVRLIEFVNLPPTEQECSESQLFDDLSAVVRNLDPEQGISAEIIHMVVHERIRIHEEMSQLGKKRLETVLCAMVMACGAGQMKRRADFLAQDILA